MNDIYSFINKGLIDYQSLKTPDFTGDIFRICSDLNALLNKDVDEDYTRHLECNRSEIQENINLLFENFSGSLYLNLVNVFDLLDLYQNQSQIGKDTYRDHYYHSVQCFLLGLVLYAQFSIFNSADKSLNNQNITTILFSLFMYHDLGYLYKTREEKRINETIKNWLININEEADLAVKKINRFFNYSFDCKTISQVSSSNALMEIWNEPYNNIDALLINEVFKIRKSNDGDQHHSYESAVLLYRFVRTFGLFIERKSLLPEGTIDIESNEKNLFLEIIKAILFHDFNMKTKLSVSNNFLASFLMIVDEIQNYGRPYKTNKYTEKIILPTKVGIEVIKSGKLKLCVDEKFTSSISDEVKKSYNKHSTKDVYNTLIEKIDKADLDKIFDL